MSYEEYEDPLIYYSTRMEYCLPEINEKDNTLKVIELVHNNVTMKDLQEGLDDLVLPKELLNEEIQINEFPEHPTQAGYQDYPYGNRPRDRVILYTEGREDQYRSLGIRDNRTPIILQTIGDQGTVLNLESYDPQQWPRVIETWKECVTNNYIKLDRNHEALEMFEYLSTFLTGNEKAMWERWKVQHRDKYEDLLINGANVHNFVNRISMLCTASDPNTGNLNTQRDAMYSLEQLSLRNWTYIKPFLSDYAYYASQAGHTFSEELCERLFKKLPGALGRTIEESWKKQDLDFMQIDNQDDYRNNVLIRVFFVVQKLKEICTKIEIERNLKGEYSACHTIFTPQKYDDNYRQGQKPSWKAQIKPKSNRIQQVRTSPKTYFGKNPPTTGPKRFVRKSNAKKPFLNNDRHVRKFKKENTYKQIRCFSCNDIGHFASNCPYKTSEIARGNKNAILIDTINEDLLKIDDTMSDNESIYSIVEDDINDRLKEMIIHQNESDYSLINEFLYNE